MNIQLRMLAVALGSVAAGCSSVERIDRAAAGHVPKRQAEQQVVRAPVDFEDFCAARTLPANDTLSRKALQVMSADCKGVTVRPEALRDATRKAANADGIRGDPMAERKARRSDKRMAVVTAVWEPSDATPTASGATSFCSTATRSRSSTSRPRRANARCP